MDLGTCPTADEVKVMLGLEPHPTCGFVAETYRSPLKIPAGALPEAYGVTAPTARPSTSSSPLTPRSTCTGYAPTNSTTITWVIH
jgi:hypothetical protein